MSGVLVVAEARRGQLRDVTLELIGAAKALGQGPLSVAVVDHEPSRLRERLAVEGVDAVLAVTTPNEHFEPHVTQRALEGLIEQERPSLVVLGPHDRLARASRPLWRRAAGTGSPAT